MAAAVWPHVAHPPLAPQVPLAQDPPPHGNFVTTPVAYRGPYEYSLPGREKDFTMQNEPVEPAERSRRMAEPALVH